MRKCEVNNLIVLVEERDIASHEKLIKRIVVRPPVGELPLNFVCSFEFWGELTEVNSVHHSLATYEPSVCFDMCFYGGSLLICSIQKVFVLGPGTKKPGVIASLVKQKSYFSILI